MKENKEDDKRGYRMRITDNNSVSERVANKVTATRL